MTASGDRAALGRVVQALRRGRRILVTSHADPDGDAIGSMSAALLALQSLGREVLAFNVDPVPRKLLFLPGTEQFVQQLPEPVRPFDTTLVLDCSDSRIFGANQLPRDLLGTLVVVDHHKTAGDLGQIVLRDPSAASVGVLLYEIFVHLGVDLALVAEHLFCSVMSDTGSFRYQNTNSEAMTVAAALLELGVNPWRVASFLYENRPRQELELLGMVLGTLEVSEDGCCASMTVTPQMLSNCGCTPEVIDGLINYARGVEGVEVAVLFRPGPQGQVRVSLRSRGAVDVSAIAQQYQGGGHRNAAGFTASGDLASVRAHLFVQVRRATLALRSGCGEEHGA